MTYTLFASNGQELVILIRLASKDFDAPSLLKRSLNIKRNVVKNT